MPVGFEKVNLESFRYRCASVLLLASKESKAPFLIDISEQFENKRHVIRRPKSTPNEGTEFSKKAWNVLAQQQGIFVVSAKTAEFNWKPRCTNTRS